MSINVIIGCHRYSCLKCGERFVWLKSLKRHTQMHEELEFRKSLFDGALDTNVLFSDKNLLPPSKEFPSHKLPENTSLVPNQQMSRQALQASMSPQDTTTEANSNVLSHGVVENMLPFSMEFSAISASQESTSKLEEQVSFFVLMAIIQVELG